MNKYFKAKLFYIETGVSVLFREFNEIHSTECYSYCVDNWNFPLPQSLKKEGETDLQLAKRIGYKVIRIHKTGSRVAFKTKDEAFEHLKYLKRLQLGHMKREIDLLQYFIDQVANKELNFLQEDKTKYHNGTIHTVKESVYIVSQHYHFN